MPATQLVVTGFSKFCGVEDNPTEDLVDWLASLPQSEFHAGTGKCACIDTLKVSMKGVDSKLVQLRKVVQVTTSPSDTVLWVHFGVAYGAQEFRLEAVGYNEADFRCPDEDGEQPFHTPIDPSQPLAAELYSQLPLNALQERLVQKGHPVAVSLDPGRFVCNYVYYRSLQQHQQPPAAPPSGSSMRAGTSVFVHVPAFEDIGRQEQRRFALDLLHEVSRAAAGLTVATAAPGELMGTASVVNGVKLAVYH